MSRAGDPRADAIAALPLGLAAFDADRRLLVVNGALAAIAGLEPGAFPPGLGLDAALRLLAGAGLLGDGPPDRLAAEFAAAAPPAARRVASLTGGRRAAVELQPLATGGFLLTAADVTEEALAREAAEAETRRLAETLGRLAAGVARYGPDRRLGFANGSYERLLGLPAGSAAPGTDLEALVRERAGRGEFGDAVGAAEAVREVCGRDRSRPWTGEERRPDGTVLRIDNQSLADGGWITEVTDITAERRAECEAERRAALQEAVLAALPLGVAVYGPDGRVALVNRAYNEILDDDPIAPGDALADILRRRAARGELGPGEPGERAADLLASIDRPRWAERLRPDGRVTTHRSVPLPDGGFVTLVSDETALHRAQAEARRRNAVLTAMLENTRHGIALFDAGGVVVAANALAADFCGLPRDAFAPGATVSDLRRLQLEAGTPAAPPEARAFLEGRAESRLQGPERYARPGPGGTVVEVVTDRLPDGGFVRSYTDVTALAHAEEEANRRAGMLRTLQENVRHALALISGDGRIVAANRLMAELAGADATEELIGLGLEELLRRQGRHERPDDPDAAEALVAAALAQDRSRPRRYQRRRPNGTWLDVATAPTADGGHVISITDVTALVEAKAEAERRGAVLQALVSNSAQGLLLYDAELRLVAGNALGAQLAGLPDLASCIGGRFADLLETQCRTGEFGEGEEARRRLQRVLRLDRRLPHRARRRRPGGRVIEIRSDPVPGGGFIVSFADVTELEEARAEAERRAAVLRATLDATQHGVLLYGPDRRVVAANDKMAALCGLSSGADMRGLRFGDVLRSQLLHEGRWAGDVDAIVAGYAAVDRSRRIRYQRQTADGRTLDVASDPTEEGGFVVSISDVTPLAEARLAAEKQAATLRATLDAAPLGIVCYGPDRRVLAANDLVAANCGLASGPELIGRSWEEVFRLQLRREGYAGDAEALVERYSGLDRGQRQRYQRRTADGRVREVLSDPTPDGGFVVAIADVTPLVEARLAAERQAAVLRATLEASRTAIAFYDRDGYVVAANDLMGRHTKHPDGAAMLGRHHRDVLRESYAQDFARNPAEAERRLAHALSLDRTRSHRYQRPGPDGRVYDVSSDPAPEGGFVVSISDVTALVQAEEAAEARARTLATMLGNIRHGICLFDARGRIVASNPKLHEMMGVPPELFAPGRTLAELTEAMRDRGEYGEGEEARATAEAILSRDRSKSHRATRRRRNGRTLEGVSDPTPDGGWVLTFTDVTEERQIRSELERARQVAEQASLAKSRFLATMSHELRTPLNAVIGFSEALRSGAAPPARTAEMAEAILEAGRHLLGLIDDILDVTRAEVGALPVLAEPLDPLLAAEGALRMVQTQAVQAGVRLALAEPGAAPPEIRADGRRVHQVLVNLLSNAIKFSAEGGSVTLSVAAEPGRGLEFLVTDSGIGIAAEDLPRVFEPFTQLDSALSRRFGGSGLGLHLSRALAEAQGATLTLDSAPGKGTVARLRFPPDLVLPPEGGTQG